MGIHLQLAVAAKSRDQVEEAQLARVLLQRIADDLRNAVPFQPPPSSSSSSSCATGQTSAPGQSAPRAVPTRQVPPALRFEQHAPAFRRNLRRGPGHPDRDGAAAAGYPHIVAGGGQRPRPACPAQRHSRRVLQPRGADRQRYVATRAPITSGTGGLYRHEQDRAEFFYCSQNGQTDDSNPATELLAPEVVDFQLTYYGGTGGTATSGTTSGGTSGSGTSSDGTTSGGTSTVDTTTNGTTGDNQWDSTQQGMLPAAVRITISLRHKAPKSVLGSHQRR